MIIIDAREHKLIDLIKSINNINNIKIPYIVKTLQIGDIIIQHIYKHIKNGVEINYTFNIILERKYVTDMIASIKDGRYKEQKIRLLSEVYKTYIDTTKSVVKTDTITNIEHKPEIETKPENIHTLICYLIEGLQTDLRLSQDKTMLNGAIISSIFRDKIPIIRTNALQETLDMINRLNDRLIKDYTDFFTINEKNIPDNNIELPVVNNIELPVVNNIELPVVNNIELPVVNNIELPVVNNNNNDNNDNMYLQSIKTCKKDNITPKIWNQMCYMNIPGISSTIAIKICNVYPTIKSLLISYEKCATEIEKELLLSNIMVNETRRIGPVISKRVKEYINI